MPTPIHAAPIYDLSAARRARKATPWRPREPRTLILSVSLLAGGADIFRHIGVNDSMSLDELHQVIDVCFGLERENPPWAMYDGALRCGASDCVHTHLDAPGATLEYVWGLWHVGIEVIDVIVRDKGTPRALCIGGSGALREEAFDPSVVNAKLTGGEVIEKTLAQVRPEVADVIRRGGMYDFIALLQALDIGRPPTQAASRELLALPSESDPRSRDAFFSTLLSLSCMSDQELTDSINTSVMESLGWGELPAAEIRAACADSLEVLARAGAYGARRLSAVDRIDIYRELLRRRA